MKDIKKYLIGGVVVVAFVLYLVFSNNNSSQVAGNNSTTTPTTPATNPTTTDTGTGSGSTGTGTGSSGGTNPTPTPTPTPTPSGQYKDGSYTGPVTDAVYGSMQVQAVISGGKLTDVKFLKFPDDPGNTTAVSNMALPQLKAEALAAQSANVDTVSGATQDSDAFKQSLSAALAMAKN